MQYHSFTELEIEWEALMNLFSEMSAKEFEIQAFGLNVVTTWESYAKAKEAFNNFDSRILELLNYSSLVNKELENSIRALVKDSKVL